MTNILAPLPGKAIIDFKSIDILFPDVHIVREDVEPRRKLILQVARAKEGEEERLLLTKLYQRLNHHRD